MIVITLTNRHDPREIRGWRDGSRAGAAQTVRSPPMTTFNPGDRLIYVPAGPGAEPEIVERVDSDHLLTRRGPNEFLWAPTDEFAPAPPVSGLGL